MDLEYLTLPMELKTVDLGQRIISGYAAIHSTMDRVDDIIDPGAFTKTLAEKAPAEIGVYIAHQVSTTLPVGVPLTIKVDGKGLWTETLVKPGPVGDDLLYTARFLLQHGQTLGQSIGYRTRASRRERTAEGKLVRRLLDVNLAEYSFAGAQVIAHPDALVAGVKSAKALSEGADTAGGVTVPEDRAMMYRIELHGDQHHVMRSSDGKDMGGFPTRAAAEAAMAALMREEASEDGEDDGDGKAQKAVWDTAYVNDLPDSAFLYVEPGEKDDAGRTVPRTKRHFPYKDKSGKIDAPHTRNSIGRIPQSNAPGLDDAKKRALQTRARRMLEQVSAGKTLEAEIDPPEWKAGAPPQLRYLAYRLLDYSEQLAEEHKALTLLGEETKAGQRIRGEMRQKLKDLQQSLADIIQWAEYVDRGEDDAAKVAHYRRQLALMELSA